MTEPGGFLTAYGVARRLGVGVQTIERWHASGYLPADVTTPRLGWREASVDAFVERARIVPGTVSPGRG